MKLTKETVLQELTAEIKKRLGSSVRDRLIVGKLLEPISADSLWKDGEYKSFEHYCYDNFGLGKSSAFNYISVYKQFGEYILSNGIEPVSHKRLLRLLPYANAENAEELAQESALLSEPDFENQMKSRQNKEVSDDHEHIMEFSHEVYQCKRCDFKQKIKK